MSTATVHPTALATANRIHGDLGRMGCNNIEAREAFEIAAELEAEAERLARVAVADAAAAGLCLDPEHLALMSMFTALSARNDGVPLVVGRGRPSFFGRVARRIRRLWRFTTS